MTRSLHRAIPVALAAVLLAGCTTAPPAPQPDPEPTTLQVAAVDGEWLVSRTVSSVTNAPGEVGDVDKRFMVVSEPECDETSCTGEFLSSSKEEIFDLGDQVEGVLHGTYEWDGTVFSLLLDNQLLDCANESTGEVVVEDLYTQVAEYVLAVSDGDDEVVRALTGEFTSTFELTEVDPQSCDAGGELIYDTEFARR
jgi:hypothetical protein